MAEMIKKFLEKKKREAKFKMAGPGYKLSETSIKQEPEKPLKDPAPAKRTEPCADARQAGMAALARFEASTSCTPSFSKTNAQIRKQVRKELEAEKKFSSSTSSSEAEGGSKHKTIDQSTFAVQGVFYRCPALGPEILTKEEWRAKIKEYLNEELEEERGLTACLIIHSCNRSKEKVQQCISTLTTYLENIISHPNEQKYHRIRISNKIFQEKVSKIDGSLDFLLAAGFENKILDNNGSEEEFLVYNPEKSDSENLQLLLDALRNAEPISIELDRNLKVLQPYQASVSVQLPEEFYDLTSQEIKREQQLRSERLENALQLKTKAMREKEEFREMKKYKFAVIRIRFPDGTFLQGTFGVYEKLKAVKEFIDENLIQKAKYNLRNGIGNQLTDADEDLSLMELRLVPASVLIFGWEQEEQTSTYLKPEILQLMKKI